MYSVCSNTYLKSKQNISNDQVLRDTVKEFKSRRRTMAIQLARLVETFLGVRIVLSCICVISCVQLLAIYILLFFFSVMLISTIKLIRMTTPILITKIMLVFHLEQLFRTVISIKLVFVIFLFNVCILYIKIHFLYAHFFPYLEHQNLEEQNIIILKYWQLDVQRFLRV